MTMLLGFDGLMNAYVSVVSANASFEMRGASRWLEADAPPTEPARMISAPATGSVRRARRDMLQGPPRNLDGRLATVSALRSRSLLAETSASAQDPGDRMNRAFRRERIGQLRGSRRRGGGRRGGPAARGH